MANTEDGHVLTWVENLLVEDRDMTESTTAVVRQTELTKLEATYLCLQLVQRFSVSCDQ